MRKTIFLLALCILMVSPVFAYTSTDGDGSYSNTPVTPSPTFNDTFNDNNLYDNSSGYNWSSFGTVSVKNGMLNISGGEDAIKLLIPFNLVIVGFYVPALIITLLSGLVIGFGFLNLMLIMTMISFIRGGD